MSRTICILVLVSAVLLSFGWRSGLLASPVKIALVVSFDEPALDGVLAGFQEQLKKQGIQAEYDTYRLGGSESKAAETIRKIRQSGAGLVLTVGSLATDRAVEELPDLPVIYAMVLRNDHLRGSTHATGVALEFSLETQFQWMRRFFPRVRSVGVLYNPEENSHRIQAAVEAALKRGFKLDAQAVSSPRELPAALDRLSKKAEVIWGLSDRVVLTPQTARSILLFSFRNRIPFIGLSEAWVKAGALFALDWDYADMGAQCGEMAFRVLTNVKVDAIPPEFPRTVRYAINLKTAEQMRLDIPEQLIREAGVLF